MEVDLLRPGTCPISPDTILWFEFLLDPNLLKNHLSKQSPDPSPTDLIMKFSHVSPPPAARPEPSGRAPDPENPDSPPLSIVETDRYSRKHLALKILCLKVAAHLKWNLNILETKLPPHIQFQLMQDLVYMATDGSYSIPPQKVSEEVLRRGGVRFSMVLYHRWLLRFLVNRALLTRQPKQEVINLGVMSAEFAQLSFEQLVRQSEDSRKYSLIFLTELTEKHLCTEQLKIPTMESFVTLTEDLADLTHDWEAGECAITDNEFLMQINYDLCSNYFFYGQYDLARKHILMCNQHKEKLMQRFPNLDFLKLEYASVTELEIFGYMKALNILQEQNGLLHDLQEAISNNYSNLIAVLQEDNLKREIPLVHRLVVELDIQGSSSSGVFTVSRDLLNKVAALNAVRSVLEGNLPSAHMDFNKRMRNLGPKFVESLLWAFTPILTSGTLSPFDVTRVKHFFLHLATSEHALLPEQINLYLDMQGSQIKLFDDDEIEDMHRELDLNKEEDLPMELLTTDWDTPDLNMRSVPELEIGCLRQRLIDATTADKTRECLVNLALTNPAQPLWTVDPQWKLSIPIQSVVMSLPRGFLQDFSYILLGKARQHAEMGDHNLAIELLLILEAEARNQLNQTSGGNNPGHAIIYKLCKLVGWEALLTQITQVLADWPNHKTNMPALVSKCNMCLASVQSGDNVIPRLEIREMCYMLLLNAGEWGALVEGVTRGSGPAEALALACQQLVRNRAGKRVPKDLWDMVLPIFATSYYGAPGMKRSNSGNPVYAGPNRDSQQMNTKMRDGMVSFFSKLRDPTVLSVVISLLARLFNILKDDSNMDLSMEYINLWPSSVPSTTFFSPKAVSDTLHQLVTQALSYYPNNISWIKLLGDMCLVGGHYSAAMKQYLSALTIMSDHFAQPLSKQSVEDQTIFKRMIKCCTQLNCPTQAAILCQFLDETDYVLAFKCLAEMSHLCSDAMDSYYGCVWDTSILEYLINLHHKRGETHRKQLAVKVMGMLELNSNNNEEIQREAANSRKAKFMRALVRQYVC